MPIVIFNNLLRGNLLDPRLNTLFLACQLLFFRSKNNILDIPVIDHPFGFALAGRQGPRLHKFHFGRD
jgi:hypothetical protein